MFIIYKPKATREYYVVSYHALINLPGHLINKLAQGHILCPLSVFQAPYRRCTNQNHQEHAITWTNANHLLSNHHCQHRLIFAFHDWLNPLQKPNHRHNKKKLQKSFKLGTFDSHPVLVSVKLNPKTIDHLNTISPSPDKICAQKAETWNQCLNQPNKPRIYLRL